MVAAIVTSFDRRKFEELILYIAEASESDPRFGATKLNKILYFSDFKAFGILGESITGATYQRLDRGPAPRELLPTLRKMVDAGEIERVERRYFNLPQKAIQGRRHADPGVFSDAERRIVDDVVEELKHLNASQVSALSHLEAGWRIARDREDIPYETVFISNRRPTPREFAVWKQGVAERRGE
jgi:hypothetical protein